jgi:xylulokinase
MSTDTELLLGVDVGTASTKGVLATPDGRVVAEAQASHELHVPRAGWAEHDAEEAWWGDFVRACRELLRDGRGERVRAVGVSGIGPCFCPVGKDGRALRPAILYGIDTRATREVEELSSALGAEAIIARTGSALTSQAVGPKLLWLRRNEPDVWARTARVLPAASLLVERLSGEYVIDRRCASGFNPLYDIVVGEWIPEWVEEVLGPDAPPLPRVLWATEVAGQVREEAARETGIPAGTPVSAGTTDAAAEALSVGVRAPGDLMLMYGSTMFLNLVVDRPHPDPRMWGMQYALPGTATVTGGMATSGALTSWFRSMVGAQEAPPPFEVLLEEAAAVEPGAEGLVCLPYFSGERTPVHDPLARGVLAGLTLSHGRAHIYRALLEATAYGVRHNLEVIDDLGAQVRRTVAVGGGVRSDLWPQIVSDVCGVDQERPAVTVGAGFGDALLAGIAAGLVPEDATWSRAERVIEPDPSRRERYDDVYAVYRAIYPATREQAHALAGLSGGGKGTPASAP